MLPGRDAFCLGIGAAFALMVLFIPIPSFFLRLVIGVFFLMLGMILALLRVGPDRVPVEVWLMRRLRYARSARRYTYYHPQEVAPEPEPQPAPLPPMPPVTHEPASPQRPAWKPVSMAWDEIGVGPLITLTLAILGAYLVVWLYQGGAAEIALFFRR